MAANDVRTNFLGSSSRRSWQSRQNVSCRISNSRCEFQTKIKPGVKNSGYCEHEQRRANLTTCPKRLQRKPTKKKTRRRAVIILKEALALLTRKSRGRQRDHWRVIAIYGHRNGHPRSNASDWLTALFRTTKPHYRNQTARSSKITTDTRCVTATLFALQTRARERHIGTLP